MPILTAARGWMLHLDARLVDWLGRNCLGLLRLALGLVFLWFGLLKFVPSLSPAEDLATRTMAVLTFGWLTPGVSRPLLATWEAVIGLGLLTRIQMRIVLLLLALQMAGTVTPLVLFPAETWRQFPFVPLLEGQYIIKNIVLIASAIVLGATVRGGAVIASPAAAERALQEQEREWAGGWSPPKG